MDTKKSHKDASAEVNDQADVRESVIFRTDEAHSTDELLGLIYSDDLSPLFEWIRQRPSLRPIILSAANAVGHALIRRIESVEHAVVYLGQRGMEQLAERLIAVSHATQSSQRDTDRRTAPPSQRDERRVA